MPMQYAAIRPSSSVIGRYGVLQTATTAGARCTAAAKVRQSLELGPLGRGSAGTVEQNRLDEWVLPTGDRGFESVSLQRRVCEPSVPLGEDDGSRPCQAQARAGARAVAFAAEALRAAGNSEAETARRALSCEPAPIPYERVGFSRHAPAKGGRLKTAAGRLSPSRAGGASHWPRRR